MIELWREWLYPIGFLSSVAFGARGLVQWLKSEASGKSVTPHLFWVLSLIGNLLLLVHSFIQAQYHVYLIQVCNAVISWRNLNLSQASSKRFTTKSTLAILLVSIAFSTALYMTLNGTFWFRIPSFSDEPVHYGWHIIGFTGLALFASRFWVQWWHAEREQTSDLGILFWWISLIGDILTLVYFFRIKDPVNLVGPVFGLVPYIRNLMLVYKSQPVKGNA